MTRIDSDLLYACIRTYDIRHVFSVERERQTSDSKIIMQQL